MSKITVENSACLQALEAVLQKLDESELENTEHISFFDTHGRECTMEDMLIDLAIRQSEKQGGV